MNINELNQKLEKLLEEVEKINIIENEINAANETVWDQLENNEKNTLVSAIVLPHLDELSVEDLAKIIEEYCDKDHSILPSGWDESYGVYPVKIAKALSQTEAHEEITDLYNIYYCNRSPEIFEEAATFWSNYIIKNPEKAFEGMEMLEYDPEYAASVYNELSENYPRLVKHILAYHAKTAPEAYNKELAEYMANN